MAGVAKFYSPAVVNVTPYNKLNIGVPADMDQLVKGSLYTGRHYLVHQGRVQREELWSCYRSICVSVLGYHYCSEKEGPTGKEVPDVALRGKSTHYGKKIHWCRVRRRTSWEGSSWCIPPREKSTHYGRHPLWERCTGTCWPFLFLLMVNVVLEHLSHNTCEPLYFGR